MDRKMELRAKRSLEEADSRGSNVETGERTRRSSHVWHALIFGNMRFVCPKDVKKMLVQTARTVYLKKWAAKHENEELKEGTPVNLDGKSRHEHAEAKLLRRGRDMLNEDEEIRSPKRKVIHVESEETQDFVKEGRSTEKEEEERTFVPSAVSVPLKRLFLCDNAAKRPSAIGNWRR